MYEKEVHSELYQTFKIDLFNMVLWIYLGIWICQGSKYTRDAHYFEYACILLNNARICLNMPEAEPKTTVQAK